MIPIHVFVLPLEKYHLFSGRPYILMLPILLLVPSANFCTRLWSKLLKQYFIYKHGEQEDKYKNTHREPMTYYYKYIEPVLLEDANNTLQYYDIHDNELLP